METLIGNLILYNRNYDLNWVIDTCRGKFLGYLNNTTGNPDAFDLLTAYAEATNKPIIIVWNNNSASNDKVIADFNDDIDYTGGRYLLQIQNGLALSLGSGPYPTNSIGSIYGYSARFGWFQGTTAKAVRDAKQFCIDHGCNSSATMMAVAYWKYRDGHEYFSAIDSTSQFKSAASYVIWANTFLKNNEYDEHSVEPSPEPDPSEIDALSTHIKYISGLQQAFSIEGELRAELIDNIVNAESISVGNAVASIKNNTFNGCIHLLSIHIPASVADIGSTSVFENCSSLVQIQVDDANTAYMSVSKMLLTKNGKQLVAGINGNVEIPDIVDEIGPYAFCGYEALADVVIPSSVESIDSNAFARCIQLESIAIPESIATIGNDAFKGCTSLTGIELPSSIEVIPANMLCGCTSLRSFSMPTAVTAIGQQAFAGCTSLNVQLTIPKNTTAIGINAFNGTNDNLTVKFVNRTWRDLLSLGNRWWGIPDADVERRILFDAVPMIVVFNANGGTPLETDKLVSYGSPVGDLPFATRYGYALAGWFTAASGGSQIDETYVIEEDSTFYAHWVAEPPPTYILQFLRGSYGSGSSDSIQKTKDIDVQLPGILFARTGYVQAGWSYDAAGNTLDYSLGSIYRTNSGATFYPYWEAAAPAQYAVQFDKKGGTGGTNSVTATFGQPLPSISVPSRDGFRFMGYFSRVDGNGTQYYNQNGQSLVPYSISSNATLYAYWIQQGSFSSSGIMMPLYGYNDVALGFVKNLNSRILNQSFTKLAKNDIGIYPVNDYIPKIWENKWFNDDTVAGYGKGDVVWKGVMTFNSFLSNFATVIQDYADGNPKLNSYFKYPPMDYALEYQRYQNVVSGYAENHGRDAKNPDWVQVLPMLFEPGSLAWNNLTATNDKISIYISMLDDNKAFLSDTMAWKPIALTSSAEFGNYISTELSLMIDQHIQDYHLGGSTQLSDFANVLLKRDFSNFDKEQLYGAPYIRNHTAYFNAQGVDFVTSFGKAPVAWSLSNSYTLYKWYRLWNSGYLEHGGYVEFPSKNVLSTNEVSDYTAEVNLAWTYGNISSISYDYPTIENTLYGDMHKILYFRDGVEQALTSSQRVLGNKYRYSISLTPVDFMASYLENGKYESISGISSEGFLVPQMANSVNFPYINYEVHQMLNTSFSVSRSLIDNGQLSSKHLNLMQYYVSGYRASVKRIYNMANCEVLGLQKIYPYEGTFVHPTVSLKSNDGETLVENVDYYVTYGPNIEIGNNTGWIQFHGYDPWRGILTKTFSIKKSIAGCSLEGVPAEVKYGVR